ncbi:hypothetical protein WMY93_008885 [Mugilogobius chulae]|uniref:Fibronectin type-III domain-containing protein n=1 Tax=Mugilogobius chulae TaxID=88201 RepID=A0AAW0PDG3_9GOBI
MSCFSALTLWNQKTLQDYMRVLPQPYTKTEIVASESISEKASSLGVNAELKASFLGGLVEVGGSAKYLNDNKKTKNQARVTLQYKTTTEFKTLTMEHLSTKNIEHGEVFDKGLATHVVTGILYGADAFFVFDQNISEDEDINEIEGSLKVVINKFPTISISGEGELKMSEAEKNTVNKFSCTFYGDFNLKKCPATFKESVKVYQDLPTLLGPGVAVEVHLLPLSILDSKAAKLVRQISVSLVTEAESILEVFRELDVSCKDALESPAGKNFSQIKDKIKSFDDFCSQFKSEFQGKLAEMLPSIRGGGEEEAGLAEVLKKTKESPFNSKRLKQWMSVVYEEINIIKAVINLLKNTEVVSSDKLGEKVNNSEKVLVFVFTSLDSKEPYLEELDNHLKRTEPNESRAEPKRWYKTREVTDRMRSKAKVFGYFADANKDQDRKELQFLAVSLVDENHKDATIYLYEDGFQSCDNFELPCKPSRVTLGRVTENSVSVQFSAPSDGAENVCRYRVEFCEEGQEQWKQQEQKEAGEVTLTGLIPNTEYRVRVRAVTEVGLGPAAPHISSKLHRAALLKNPGPPPPPQRSTSAGGDLHRWDQALRSSDTSWSTLRQRQRSVEERRRETEYILRIFCDCGEDGTSSKSSTVTITTRTSAVECFVKESVKISSGIPEIYKLKLKSEELPCSFGLKKYVFGKKSHKEHRSVLLLGPAGSGKTSLINAMINYVLGVKWTDPFRFLLCEEQKTSETVLYQINHQEGFQVDFSLTIIDTPGFGDMKRDAETKRQIYMLFSDLGITDIHAVCFVLPSDSDVFGPILPHILDSALSIWGKDVSENIRILVTFAENETPPPVLQTFIKSEVPGPKTEDGLPVHFKFNNSPLFVQSDTDTTENSHWNMGNTSMKNFFCDLEKNEPKSLTLTKEVIILILELENKLEPLQSRVKLNLVRHAEIRQAADEEMKRNEKPHQIDLSGTRHYSLNCQQCHYTCFYPCFIANDADTKKCKVFDGNGRCTVCSGKCVWSDHYSQKYKWEYRQVPTEETIKDKKKTTEQFQLEQIEFEIAKLINKSFRQTNRLNEIALKPNALSASNYIASLMEEEKREAEPGWRERVDALMAVKETAEYLDKLNKKQGAYA